MPIEIGSTIGDYQVLGILGQGGMGTVYRVRNILSHREEAMKVVLPESSGDQDAADRFLREIRLHASLQHPNIAALRTAMHANNHVLMIMELIDGTSVSAKLKQGPLPFHMAFRIVDDILGALDYAHSRGVIHRDIKPANIMVTSRGLAKLMDFGIARSDDEARLTRTNLAIGSVFYMSPEQINSSPVDARSDLYSFGATFYEMVTGRVPINGPNEYAIMHAQLNDPPVPPVKLVPALPVAVSDLILKSLAKAPLARFQSAREFRDALRDAQFGAGPLRERSADPPRPSRLALPDETSARDLRPAPSVPPPPARAPQTPLAAHPSAVSGFSKSLLQQTGPRDALDEKSVIKIQTRLAGIIGPIAKTLVNKAAPRHNSLITLCQELAGQIPDPGDRGAFLKSFGATAAPAPPHPDATRTIYTPTPGQGAIKGTPITEKTLEIAREALTDYLGPIAAVLVKKAAKRVSTVEELRDALAAEISDPRSQAAFLKRVRP